MNYLHLPMNFLHPDPNHDHPNHGLWINYYPNHGV